jgi:hypothetical protein
MPPTCADLGYPTIYGTLGGQPIDESWNATTIGAVSTDPYWVERDFSVRGRESLRSSLAGDPLAPAPGVYPLDFAVLHAPDASAHAGSVICFGDGVLDVAGDGSQVLTTTHAELLGPCPGGTPVTGDVVFCNTCPVPISGDIDGIPLSSAGYDSYGGGDPYPASYLHYATDELLVRAYTDATLDGAGVSGDIEGAVLFTLPEGPFGGDVFCAGPGSTYEYLVTGTDVQVALHNLTRLGTCTASSGTDSLLLCR